MLPMKDTLNGTKTSTADQDPNGMIVEPVNSIIERVSAHEGVEGVIVTDKEGFPLASTMEKTRTLELVEKLLGLTNIANSVVRDLNPVDKLDVLRIGTLKDETMIRLDTEYVAIVVQNKKVGGGQSSGVRKPGP